jgi:hypothetical protein
VEAAILPMLGPYGVWVHYQPMMLMVQQVQGGVAGPNARPLVFCQSNFN